MTWNRDKLIAQGDPWGVIPKKEEKIHQIPIAETFHSIQGEGTWTGTPMHFIRLAGCPVGKKATQDFAQKSEPGIVNWLDEKLNTKPNFPIYPSKCQTWDGRYFDCDTDFSCHTYKTVSELVGETWEKHVCLTGGEPLIHERRLVELGFFQQMFSRGVMIHYETSGTVQTIFDFDNQVWIAVAPKQGCLDSMLRRADEIKLLVDKDWDEFKVSALLAGYVNFQVDIFLSPINDEKEVNQENVQRALKILESHPTWRLSCQWHKFLNLR